jgi:hypothetical protein
MLLSFYAQDIDEELRGHHLKDFGDDAGWLAELETLGVQLVEIREELEGLKAPPGSEDIKAGLLTATDHLTSSVTAFEEEVVHRRAGNGDEAENLFEVAMKESELGDSLAVSTRSLMIRAESTSLRNRRLKPLWGLPR